MKRFKSVLISGWFGEENLGDELILKSSIQMIKEIDANITINVMGTKPKKIKKDHSNINRISTYVDNTLKSKIRLVKYNPFNVYMNIKKSDALILASGGALSDWNIDSTNCLFYIIDKFSKADKPIFMLGCGAGPISKEESYKLFYNKLKYIKNITLRDQISYDELKKIGLKNIQLTNDVVFDIELDNNYSKKIKNKRIGIVISSLSMREDKENKYIHDLIKYVKILKDNNFNVTLIPFQYNNDINIMSKIAEAESVDIFENGKDDVWRLLDILQQQDVVVGSRFHCVLTCILLGIPILPIIYHHKVFCLAEKFKLLEFAENVGDGSNWKDEGLDVDRMYKNTLNLYNNSNNISDEMLQLKSVFKRENNNINKKLLTSFIEDIR